MINLVTIINTSNAVMINSAEMLYGGDCGSLLTYNGFVVKVTYVQYNNNGNYYPAYCLDKVKMRSRK